VFEHDAAASATKTVARITERRGRPVSISRHASAKGRLAMSGTPGRSRSSVLGPGLAGSANGGPLGRPDRSRSLVRVDDRLDVDPSRSSSVDRFSCARPSRAGGHGLGRRGFAVRGRVHGAAPARTLGGVEIHAVLIAAVAFAVGGGGVGVRQGGATDRSGSVGRRGEWRDPGRRPIRRPYLVRNGGGVLWLVLGLQSGPGGAAERPWVSRGESLVMNAGEPERPAARAGTMDG
jgi:hypothetical protein